MNSLIFALVLIFITGTTMGMYSYSSKNLESKACIPYCYSNDHKCYENVHRHCIFQEELTELCSPNCVESEKSIMFDWIPYFTARSTVSGTCNFQHEDLGLEVSVSSNYVFDISASFGEKSGRVVRIGPVKCQRLKHGWWSPAHYALDVNLVGGNNNVCNYQVSTYTLKQCTCLKKYILKSNINPIYSYINITTIGC